MTPAQIKIFGEKIAKRRGAESALKAVIHRNSAIMKREEFQNFIDSLRGVVSEVSGESVESASLNKMKLNDLGIGEVKQ